MQYLLWETKAEATRLKCMQFEYREIKKTDIYHQYDCLFPFASSAFTVCCMVKHVPQTTSLNMDFPLIVKKV